MAGSESYLLTRGAVGAVSELAARPRSSAWGEGLTVPRIEALLGEFLRYHANQGRETLVVLVAKTMARDCHSYPAWTLFKDQAEVVVTALFGEATDV